MTDDERDDESSEGPDEPEESSDHEKGGDPNTTPLESATAKFSGTQAF